MEEEEEAQHPQTDRSAARDAIDPFLPYSRGLFREVGHRAAWRVSSWKGGFGPERMRDDRQDTFWQSDGQLPHTVSLQFDKKRVVSDLCLLVDYTKDESYTPLRVRVRSGSCFADLRTVEDLSLDGPEGWAVVPLRSPDRKAFLKTFLLQLVVLANHHNGRDSHIRLLKVHSPADLTYDGLLPVPKVQQNFTEVEFLQYSTVR